MITARERAVELQRRLGNHPDESDVIDEVEATILAAERDAVDAERKRIAAKTIKRFLKRERIT